MEEYNIKGVIVQQPYDSNTRFWGKFICKDDGTLEGKLVDFYGHSEIKGEFNPKKGTLKFEKKYLEREDIINYQFEKGEIIYGGTFDSMTTYNGDSFCEVYGLEEKFQVEWEKLGKDLALSKESSERRMRQVIEYMKEKGDVITSVDPQSREEMVYLINKKWKN